MNKTYTATLSGITVIDLNDQTDTGLCTKLDELLSDGIITIMEFDDMHYAIETNQISWSS